MNEDFLIRNNLQKLRAKLKWPQWKVGVAAGITDARISLLEQGMPPRTSEIQRLTAFFKVNTKEIWPNLVE
jgi:predicted transcriptional regulator